MAANDYYNSFSNQQRPNRRSDAPLPPVPGSQTAYQPYGPTSKYSPLSISFDESNNSHTYPQQSQQSLGSDKRYYGAGVGGHAYQPSPYSEDIPLQPHQSKPDHETGAYDQHRQDNDAAYAARLGGQENRHRGGRRRRGFFKGPIPWVVYAFTLVQLIIFFAELGRNGKLRTLASPSFSPIYAKIFSLSPPQFLESMLTIYRYSYRITHRSQTAI